MTRTPLNLTSPSFIENPSFQLSARSFVMKDWDFLQKADVWGFGVFFVWFFLLFFFFQTGFQWHYSIFCAKIIEMEISLSPLLGCQSQCNWKCKVQCSSRLGWCLRCQSPKGLSSLHALCGFFSPFSFLPPEHSTRTFLRAGQMLMCPCQQHLSSQGKTGLASALRT